MKTRRRPPRVEKLERRDVPATFGVAWPDPQHLTLSFVPDGTNAHQNPSDLFQSLQRQGLSQAAWQAAVLRAVQSWIAHANLNVGVVAEQGQHALGARGAEQGDPRFGDLRIAGTTLGAANQLAISTPHDPDAGTLAGDILVNTGQNFGGESGFDLTMVMLQEIGHAFGLADTTDLASVMYETYRGVHGLAASDVAAIQTLYGERSADAFEGLTGNDTFATATDFRPTKGALEADVTTDQDADVYKFTVPTGAGPATIQVLTSGLSLLQARVTVYDAAGNVVGTGTASGPGADVSVGAILLPGATYYVTVAGAANNGFGVGSYQLQVGFVGIASKNKVRSGLITSGIPDGPDSQSGSRRQIFAFDGGVARTDVQTVMTLTSTRSQIFRLDLLSNVRHAGGTVTVLDATGRVVATLTPNSLTSSAFVLLDPGTYTIRLDARADLSLTGKKVYYGLGVKVVSDPIDAYPSDPTEDPSGGGDGGGDPPPPPPPPPGEGDDDGYWVWLADPTTPPWWPPP
jgi:predicted Zn-dependent protease